MQVFPYLRRILHFFSLAEGKKTRLGEISAYESGDYPPLPRAECVCLDIHLNLPLSE